MPVLSPEAAVKYWAEALEEARRSPQWRAMCNSPEFVARIEREWDSVFGPRAELPSVGGIVPGKGGESRKKEYDR